MYLTADNLAHYLLARGLVDRADVVRGDYLTAENSRRNRNFRVFRRNAPSLFVKQLPTVTPDTVASVRREAECCRLIGELPQLAGLRDLVPRLVDFNETAHIVATALIVNGQNFNERHNSTRRFDDALGRLQGHALGTIHAATAAALPAIGAMVALPRLQPWFFNALHRTHIVLPNISPAMRQVVTTLQQLPDVMAAFTFVQSDWKPSCLTHNDVKWDNIVAEGDGDAMAVRIVDWELGDIGDPSWDVACIFAAYVQYWLFYIHPADASANTAINDGKFADLRRGAAAFWREYVRCAGVAPHDAQQLLTRSIHLAGVRLLQTFLETQGVANAPLPTTPLLLNVARHILANVHMCQHQVFGIDCADSAGVVTLDAAIVPVTTTVAPTEIAAPGPPAADGVLDRLPSDILLRICESVHIDSPVSLRVADQVFAVAPGATGDSTGGATANPSAAQPDAVPPGSERQTITTRLVETLWPALYWTFYTRQRLRPPAVDEQPDPVFVEQLSAANDTQDGQDPAWQVYRLETTGAVHVRKGNAYRLILPQGYVSKPGRQVAVGDRVSVLVSREARAMMPGFYFAFSAAIGSEFDDSHLCRIYFNLTADGAPHLVRRLTAALNRFEIPFRFKCLNQRAAYAAARADAGVLYVSRRFFDITLRLIAADYDALLPGLNTETCLFTKFIAPGIGAAEDPKTGESFGQSRMRLVSRGIVDAWYDGLITSAARLAAIDTTFRTAGLSLRSPHLNGGSADFQGWPA